MSARYIISDVFEGIATLPDNSVDLAVTSPPFLALRSYLPTDHPDKHKEIGSEPDPATFLDTLLAVAHALDRVLAPHGSLVFELGDTYAGSGGAGGDYGDEGWRAGQLTFKQQRQVEPKDSRGPRLQDRLHNATTGNKNRDKRPGWPLDKSLCGIPTLFAWSLAYGRNLLRGPMSARELLTLARQLQVDGFTFEDALSWLEGAISATDTPLTFAPWRIRNVIPWCRPNPPVGALGDKWRPATSYVTVACRARDRWFDLDAVRTEHKHGEAAARGSYSHGQIGNRRSGGDDHFGDEVRDIALNPAGAPPLDWFMWDDPESEWSPDDGMWVIPTAPYAGAHYACWPPKLAHRIIDCMCPREVCRVCGAPRRRITDVEYLSQRNGGMRDGEPIPAGGWRFGRGGDERGLSDGKLMATTHVTTLGWTDCACRCERCDACDPPIIGGPWPCRDKYRPGIVLDPFAGSGTTLAVASGLGRDSIGIDLDSRNADLAMERVGPLLLTVEYPERTAS